jgi:hypothetical protein
MAVIFSLANGHNFLGTLSLGFPKASHFDRDLSKPPFHYQGLFKTSRAIGHRVF